MAQGPAPDCDRDRRHPPHTAGDGSVYYVLRWHRLSLRYRVELITFLKVQRYSMPLESTFSSCFDVYLGKSRYLLVRSLR